MSYTVKNLAEFSGVSIRTLHYYDEIGLLKPAFISESGYRYYQDEQLLMLQQILFFRELGFELKQIKKILARSDFDKRIALQAHKKILQDKIKRLQELTATVTSTINTLEGKHTMNQEIFKGFDIESEEQKRHEKYLEEYVSKFGAHAQAEMKKHMLQAQENVKKWSNQEWQTIAKEFDTLCIELSDCIQRGLLPDSPEVQNSIRKHYEWLGKFWTPNKESYSGHADLIKQSDLKNAYNKYHPELANFISAAIKIFARLELK